ncbi:methylated-DNA--[protein]-cysteine S-methyltransferase [Staphylospora marina]|uniref:methylated-DNA--[protein]-cysteine S-methyltransferase n=1 Tax=Staphylospora marina TaxID=2490858 RepID=UPI000F5BA8F8|nr:methylated-DNA--[protein]-cysteine S-methyltransferase [Staphylospora marina]
MSTGSQTIAWSQMESPIGTLTLALSRKGLCHLTFNRPNAPLAGLTVWFNQWYRNPRLERNDRELEPVVKQLDEYFNKERFHFELPLDFCGTPFQKLVWKELTNIPYGEVRSYKDVAQAIGAPKAVRAIGGANNKNPISIIVPCHRVIGANGSLVGYGGGLHIKEYLLTLEGWLKQESL